MVIQPLLCINQVWVRIAIWEPPIGASLVPSHSYSEPVSRSRSRAGPSFFPSDGFCASKSVHTIERNPILSSYAHQPTGQSTRAECLSTAEKREEARKFCAATIERHYDERLKRWNAELDMLLVFVGLP